ncbi:MAG: TerB family tellurite resistance protein [SAR324 cluster bacterium]|nr:TerB family tellurite resistance protein [SAR324 cluster bacterium]
MRLPDICRTSIKTRLKYLSLVGYMARIDGQLDKEEVALLKKMSNRFQMSEKHEKQIFSEQTFSKQQIEEVFNELKEKDLQYSFILDMIAMAIADGIILEPERLMLAQISGLIGLKHEEFHNLINFAQATSNLTEEGNSDPMFQYVIEMFFKWARNKDVRLFRQTTFAINDKIDAYLKEDL